MDDGKEEEAPLMVLEEEEGTAGGRFVCGKGRNLQKQRKAKSFTRKAIATFKDDIESHTTAAAAAAAAAASSSTVQKKEKSWIFIRPSFLLPLSPRMNR